MAYTIVGGGAAAVSALKALRERDPRGPVTVVSEEEHNFYYRPMIPLVVTGDRGGEDLFFHGDTAAGIDFIHDRAVSLDPANREINLFSGRRLAFDRLLIATGSSPVVPDVPGVREENVFVLRSLSDGLSLQERAGEADRAVIAGGGFVGIKLAQALSRQGISVTVAEQADRILFPRIDYEAAAIVEKRLARTGITCLTGVTITGILEGGRGVELADGRTLRADLVCLAVGVRPNIDWLGGSGLAMERALRVDARMQTNIPGIYAAGDVVESIDPVTRRTVVNGLWSQAVTMGRTAGTNMAGGKMKYGGSLEVLNATDIDGLPLISVGDVLAGGNDYEVIKDLRRDVYRKLVFKDDTLAGYIFLGDIDRAGIYTALLRSRRPLGPLKKKMINRTITCADCLVRSHT